MVWLDACSNHGNLGCGWVKVDYWRVFREVVYDGSVVLVVAQALGLDRRGATDNIRRSIKCFKMRYFI